MAPSPNPFRFAASLLAMTLPATPTLAQRWNLRLPVAAPPAMAGATSTYDSGRAVVVMFGGSPAATGDQTWEFDGLGWHQVPTATRPPARSSAFLAYDPVRRVTVLFGGYGSTGATNDTW